MTSTDTLSLYSIKSIMILDQDGNRVLAKVLFFIILILKSFSIMIKNYSLPTKNRLLLKKVFLVKLTKQMVFFVFLLVVILAEIILIDGLISVYRSNVDLFFYVVGSAQENELLLLSVLNCLYDSFSTVLRKNALFECIDIAFLIMDEICDDGVILETDSTAIISRCAARPEDLAFGDQSLSQLLGSAKDQFKWSLLK